MDIKITGFWNVMPCGLVDRYWRYLLAPFFMTNKGAVFCVVMLCSVVEVHQGFRGTSVDFYRVTQCYNVEDHDLHNQNFKSNKIEGKVVRSTQTKEKKI
jgi:hypothetical protein